MEKSRICSMGDYFNAGNVRKELIEGLQKDGHSQERIKELIEICDIAYKEYKIPYPTITDLIKI